MLFTSVLIRMSLTAHDIFICSADVPFRHISVEAYLNKFLNTRTLTTNTRNFCHWDILGEPAHYPENYLKGQKGETGYAGMTGPQGLFGETGPEGPPGNDGPRGDRGLKGMHILLLISTEILVIFLDRIERRIKFMLFITGDTGPKGDKGTCRSTVNFVGPPGQSGEKGDKGDRGKYSKFHSVIDGKEFKSNCIRIGRFLLSIFPGTSGIEQTSGKPVETVGPKGMA